MFVPVLSAVLTVAAPASPPAAELRAASETPVLAYQAVDPDPVSDDQGASATTNSAQPVIVLPPADPTPAAPAAPAQPAATTGREQIVVTGQTEPSKSDPAQAVNQASYEVVQKVDDAIVAPLAMGYKHALPPPIRSGLRNFLRNLTEPVVFLNFLLQGKPGKAAETLGRFAINSTIGLAGTIDVAKNKPFNLPHRENGFANTLGYYGVGPGPYLFLPLIGPTTVRDLFGFGVDRSLLPLTVGKPFTDPLWVLGSGTIKSLDDRVQLDCELQAQRQTSNPYNTAREYYLERRKADIEALHGRKYQPVGHSLLEIMNQCAAGQQRAKAPVQAPPEE